MIIVRADVSARIRFRSKIKGVVVVSTSQSIMANFSASFREGVIKTIAEEDISEGAGGEIPSSDVLYWLFLSLWISLSLYCAPNKGWLVLSSCCHCASSCIYSTPCSLAGLSSVQIKSENGKKLSILTWKQDIITRRVGIRTKRYHLGMYVPGHPRVCQGLSDLSVERCV